MSYAEAGKSFAKRDVITFDDLKRDLLKRDDVRAEHEALAEAYSLAEALIRARSEADLTQTQVADRMRTSQSYVAKLEGGQVSPSIKALQRFAAATGTRLEDQPRTHVGLSGETRSPRPPSCQQPRLAQRPAC